MGEASDIDVTEIADRLREAGIRVTPQRQAVIEALVEAGTHPTAEDLARIVAERHPDIHRSSVYRTLDILGEHGLVSHVHLGHGGAIYHLATASDLHLACSGCGVVLHTPAAVLSAARETITATTGFDLRPGHMALPGLCADCLESERAASQG